MSDSERSPLPADEHGHPGASEEAPQPASDSSPPERPRKSRLRPPPPDWQPQHRSEPRAAAPMVVVYSGDSERPPADWSQDYQSSRLTLSETPHLPLHEPFPLASDLEANSGRTLRLPAMTGEAALAELDARAARAAEQSNTAAAEPRAEVEVEPSQPATPPASARRLGVWVALLLGAGTFAAVWTRLPHGPPPLVATVAPNRAEPEPSNASISAPAPIEEAAQAVLEQVTPDSPSTSAAPAGAETAAASATLGPESSAPPVAENAESNGATVPTVRVVLDVSPRDSKVTVDGAERTGTPPYRFDVPRGSHLVLKIEHPGYVTRRVELDGNKTALAVGLLRKHRGGAKHSAEPGDDAE